MDAEPNLKIGRQLKELPPDVQAFTANGTRYRVSRSVSMDRWEAYELLSVEIGMARSFTQFMDGLREAYDMCNQVAAGKPVFADLAVLLRDMLIGSTLVGEKQQPAVLKMAALFINYEGEDVRFIDDGIIQKKIDDWREEGIDMQFFFGFALRSIPGFFEAYKVASRDTSKPIEPEKKAQGDNTSK